MKRQDYRERPIPHGYRTRKLRADQQRFADQVRAMGLDPFAKPPQVKRARNCKRLPWPPHPRTKQRRKSRAVIGKASLDRRTVRR